MSSNKSLRRKFSRKTRSSFDVDITSLLDILIILLFFLLKNYNTTGVLQSIPKEIALPFSESSTPSFNGILVQASKNSIWVDEKKVYENKDKTKENNFPLVAGEIIPLYDELVKKREKIQQLEEVTKEAQKFTGLVSLVVEKSLRYSEVKKLMATCANAGFMKFKLSVNSF
tara:strand:+ start:95 stop:607 length:513 start_codon:yes stop_codon:yes gene_type:complete